MKPEVTGRKSVRGRHSYTKVRDNRKQPIRGLWRRNGRFMARLRAEDGLGHKQLKWFALQAQTWRDLKPEKVATILDRRKQFARAAAIPLPQGEEVTA